MELSLTDAVSAAIESGCAAESLARIGEADPASVRAAIAEVVQTWRSAAHPGLHTRVAGRWRRHEITHTVWLPDPLPEGLLPLLVMPAHPTWPTSARDGSHGDGRSAVMVVNGFNVAYQEAPRRYLRLQKDSRFRGDVEEALSHALSDALAHFPLDPDRAICHGISASGNHCWVAGQQMPGRFAALWPVSAGWHPSNLDVLANLRDTAVRVQHGEADPKIPDEWVQSAVDGLVAIGAPHEVAWVEGGGHGDHPAEVWDAGSDWALEQRRPDPASLHLARDAELRPTSVGWLHVDGEDSISVDAAWDADAVRVTSSAPAAIELWWRPGEGPGRGRSGESLRVVRDGVATEHTLVEDPITPLLHMCATGDLSRLPAGRVLLGTEQSHVEPERGRATSP